MTKVKLTAKEARSQGVGVLGMVTCGFGMAYLLSSPQADPDAVLRMALVPIPGFLALVLIPLARTRSSPVLRFTARIAPWVPLCASTVILGPTKLRQVLEGLTEGSVPHWGVLIVFGCAAVVLCLVTAPGDRLTSALNAGPAAPGRGSPRGRDRNDS